MQPGSQQEEAVEGFEIPLCRAALKPKLLVGVPQDFAMVTGGLLVAAFFLKMWPLYPIGVGLHLLGVGLTRWDPQWFPKVCRAVWEYARYYKP